MIVISENTDEVLETGEWTDWSQCSQQGFEARSRACEYGRKIQRRGCPARQPLQGFVDRSSPPEAAPFQYAPRQPSSPATAFTPYAEPREEPNHSQNRLTQSPYDQYAL
ncbi:hypothetical protein OSTOST_23569, partial [Ostertagia ostertagi]